MVPEHPIHISQRHNLRQESLHPVDYSLLIQVATLVRRTGRCELRNPNPFSRPCFVQRGDLQHHLVHQFVVNMGGDNWNVFVDAFITSIIEVVQPLCIGISYRRGQELRSGLCGKDGREGLCRFLGGRQGCEAQVRVIRFVE